MEALEKEHGTGKFQHVRSAVETWVTLLEQDAQTLGFRFRFGDATHTDCGGNLVSDAGDTDRCLKCGKSGTILPNDDPTGTMRYRFQEEWDEKGDWYKW
jgi:hypothetical protein